VRRSLRKSTLRSEFSYTRRKKFPSACRFRGISFVAIVEQRIDTRSARLSEPDEMEI